MENGLRGGWQVLIRDTSPEGLLNALAERELPFHGMERMDAVTVYLQVSYTSIGRLREIAEARGSELLFCRPFGIPLKARRVVRRYGLLVALLVCLVLLSVSNLFVWRIEVTGNDTVPTGAVLRELTKAGGGIGSFWPKFDSERMRTELLIGLEDLQWVAVNYRGGAIEVVVREKRETPNIIDNEAPYHVVAEKSGMLTSLAAKQGQLRAAAGDTVEQGQILIAGGAVSSIGTTRAVHALGTAKARTWYSISAKQPAEIWRKTYTGRERVKISLIFGTKRINLYSNGSILDWSCDTITMDYHLCMNSVFSTPLRIRVQRCAYYEVAEERLETREQEERAQAALLEQLKQRMDEDGSVTSTAFASAPRDEGVTVTLMAECSEEIGKEVPMSEEELREIQADHNSREETTND